MGSIAGFLAGLLGIGGGAVLVPGLYYMYTHFGFSEAAMHTAVGTSLLTILLTGTASARSHHKLGAVDIPMLQKFIPGIVGGVIIGSILALYLSAGALKASFAVLQISFALYMLIRGNKISIYPTMPSQPWFSIIAAINAALAALMGVGGGVQNVIYMTICNVPLARAIGTASALGPVIAVLGAIGFMIIGQSSNATLPYSTGFVHWPAFFCIILTSVVTAPIGAKLTHQLPTKKLKSFFTAFIFIISIKMIYEVLFK
ncbi:MAG: sulfite exporter TauE/SafE family protein [Pseudomonadota bacterium]|nr:sulfite exporter TauE/SafE family protein [Pseudomonadota bacterium]